MILIVIANIVMAEIMVKKRTKVKYVAPRTREEKIFELREYLKLTIEADNVALLDKEQCKLILEFM